MFLRTGIAREQRNREIFSKNYCATLVFTNFFEI